MRRVPFCTLLVLLGCLVTVGTVTAHDREPTWIDESTYDQGLYFEVRHPRVIREAGRFPITVLANNLATDGDVRVRELRYDAGEHRQATRRFDQVVPSKRTVAEEYRIVRRQLIEAGENRDVAQVDHLRGRRAVLLADLASRAFSDRFEIEVDPIEAGEEASVELTVEIDLLQGGVTRTLRRAISIPIELPLPDGGAPARELRFDARTGELTPLPPTGRAANGAAPWLWYSGDQHLHTRYSIDAFFLSGTVENVQDYAAVAQLSGLDWIVTTDHSNIHVNLLGLEFYTPEQFEAAASEAQAYRDDFGFLVFAGQEMGIGSRTIFNLPSHYLALPSSVDSMGFLPNPGSGLVFGHPNCEDEQVIIDRVNEAGGIGFVAHPFSATALFYVEWDFDNQATGWAGFEIWSDEEGVLKPTDQLAIAKWMELLADIDPPTGGQLADRPGFPTRFPVGLGNSDAHEPGLIGNTFTYCGLDTLSRDGVMHAFRAGRCVASNGPLAFGEINGAGIGEVALVVGGENQLEVTLQTTPEFGPVGDFWIIVYVDGIGRVSVPPTGTSSFSTTFVIDDLELSGADRFIHIAATKPDASRLAFTNPIWLQFVTPGDLNGDDAVNHADVDLLASAWGPCRSCAEDINGDDVVGMMDLYLLLMNWN